MASFKNLQDLLSYVSKEASSGKGQLGKDIAEEKRKLAEEYVQELQELILANLQAYYNSYSPVRHKRTYQQLDIFNNVGLQYDSGEVTFGFGPSAMQENAVRSNPHMSFVPHLLNSGWRLRGAKNYRGRGNRFMYFEGSFFIDNAIEEFNTRHQSEGIVAFYY